MGVVVTNKAAQALSRLAKGKPKNFTKAERKRRAERLAAARLKRWPAKSNDSGLRSPDRPRAGDKQDRVVGSLNQEAKG